MKDFSIEKWIHYISENHKLMEYKEGVVYHIPRDEGVMSFLIRSLANVNCEGSKEMLDSILEHRLKTLEEAGVKTIDF